MIERGENQEREREREREERMGELEREVHGERVYTGGREFEGETRGSQTQESRRVDATNARFETRVQASEKSPRGGVNR